MRTTLAFTTLIAVAMAGLSLRAGQAARGQSPDELPAEVRARVARAEEAMNALQSALISRLGEEMARGGPASAVSVCRDEAPAITARVAREQGLAIGRTSHQLRNPANTVPAWAEALVRDGAGTRVAAHAVRVFDLGETIGVARPIGFVDMCGACHGPAETIPPQVRDVVAKAYPSDAAVGFAPGDLRGWMWAEVPRR